MGREKEDVLGAQTCSNDLPLPFLMVTIWCVASHLDPPMMECWGLGQMFKMCPKQIPIFIKNRNCILLVGGNGSGGLEAEGGERTQIQRMDHWRFRLWAGVRGPGAQRCTQSPDIDS